MGDATYVQHSFLGGEWSDRAQGRFDVPIYRTAMNVCLNNIPIETGACTRRPGFKFIGTTRSGAQGRLIKFDLQRAQPYNMEFTPSWLRFFNGENLVTTNDDATVSSISSANPAKVATSAAHGWSTGNQVFFNNLGVNNPLLQNRLFLITVTSSTEFTIADAITGTNIDGSTLGTFVSGTVSRALEIATPYGLQAISGLRAVQAYKSSLLLEGSTQPQMLALTAAPTASSFATFSLTQTNFIDGPYLDPVAGGAQLTPSAVSGNVTLTITFPAYDSSKVYLKGDFVTSSSVKYQSLVNDNLGNTPASNPTKWQAVSGGAAIGPNGFVGSDIGRAIRLFSQPQLWAVGTEYAAGVFVTYNNTYWRSLTAGNVGNIPGRNTTSWALVTTDPAVVWTWGRITGVSNFISGSLSGSTNFGTAGGTNISAAFDGNRTKASTDGPTIISGATGAQLMSAYIGKNYSGASDQTISFAVVYPCTNIDFASLTVGVIPFTITWNLRGKASSPSSSSDGTLLGTTGEVPSGRAPITINSTNASAWKYVWVEAVVSTTSTVPGTDNIAVRVAQIEFYTSAGSNTTISVQILGDNLLYTAPILVWRLGAYSNTTGWPTCGCFHEGRLWLSGAIANRIDSCVVNGQSLVSPERITFSPTGTDGTVSDSNAISYTFNSKDENVVQWMEPDQQGIICGTSAGEWLVQASNLNSPLTPTSIQAHRVTKIGCANIEPRRTEHTLVFVQAFQRKLMEYFADVFSGKFSAPNLTEKAKHLTTEGLAEIAYQQELAPVIWARDNVGTLLGCTYKRETLASSQGPTFNGWHPHELGSGRVVESICVGPSQDGSLDSLTIITNDESSGVRHVELLHNMFDEGADLADGWFLDDAVTPTFTQNVTIAGVSYFQCGGLWHLNDKTVTVFAGGLDCGDYTVSSGVVNVPYGRADADGLFTASYVSSYVGTMPVVVGFSYESRGQVVRPATPAETGARTGPALGKLRRQHMLAVLLENTGKIKFGTEFVSPHLKPAIFQSPGGTKYTSLQLFSGVHRMNIEDITSFDSMACWQVTRPFPATIVALEGFIQTQDA